jgi:hypothetical protein
VLESNENETKENDRMKSLLSLLQSYLLIYKWIQSLPRGVSLGRKVSGEGVDHMLYIFCNTVHHTTVSHHQTASLVVGAINTPNHPTFKSSKFSYFNHLQEL